MRPPAEMTAAAPEFEPFLTAREVADRLRIAPCTVLRYFDEGSCRVAGYGWAVGVRCASAGARSRRR